MWRVIGCWVAVATLVLMSPSMAHSAADEPTTPVDTPDAIVCQLLAGCPSSDPAAAAPAPRGGRVARTRGFSFRDKGDGGDVVDEQPAAAPAATGRYDLRIGFMFASAELTQDDRARTAAFALALRDPRIVDRRVRIEGHTDSIGGDAANLDLSRRRARAVGDALVAAGVDGSRLDLEGYGARRPLPGVPAESGANRRVIAALSR
ncbi:OmpA family protein [Sphingomonas profundi]|uniref:OmpA family protein n=1 Tax=Alterirhizorhabdus profundi TaxID=2681549 RepID=UPI001E3AEEBC|nr:OmpA family protein [Sphingomonas profundi]